MNERFYKKIYSHRDFYKCIVLTFRGTKYLKLNKRKELISPQFKERIMLAVTEVNGCEACSYAHTKFALETGMNSDEINAILDGDIEKSPKNELVALLFAQHYTDEKGAASKESWQRLTYEYGKESAMIILAIIRMMNTANIYGIAISAIKDRFKGKPSKKTTLWYEISILVFGLFYIPTAAIHAAFYNIIKKSILPF